MLIQFNFKNYKSFRDETTLDLSATRIKDFNERIIIHGNEKILPIACIYGANASGKSNVYSAFEDMTQFVLNSFSLGGNKNEFDKQRPTPFLFDDISTNADTTFEVYFTIPNDLSKKTYNYGFSIGTDGISEEWLNIKAKTSKEYKQIIYRNKEVMDLTGIPKKSRENIEIALQDEVLIISLGAKLNIETCSIVYDWFVNNEFANFAHPISNLILSRTLPCHFTNNEQVQSDVVQFLSSFDHSIQGFEVEKAISNDTETDERFSIYTLHKKVNSDDFARIPLCKESAGTLKMFSLYQSLTSILNNGGILFIDELNARLHPLLVRSIMLAFMDPNRNTKHAQLILTSHKTWILSKEFLRRDEIWFTEKSEEGCSSLFSLYDFMDDQGNKIRNDESFEKNYLQGKYGAIPILSKFNFITEEKNGES